jgi:hypothetical protein
MAVNIRTHAESLGVRHHIPFLRLSPNYKWRNAMVDYYTVQQLAQRAKVTETAILELEKDGFLQRTAKNGRIFFSSRQEYLLRAAVRWAHKGHLALKDALYKVAERRLAAKTTADKNGCE